MIKSSRDYQSTTIIDINPVGQAEIGYKPFKQALYDKSHIIYYQYGDRFYYPISLEFRLIDNNIAFLYFELGLRDTKDVNDILVSSMLKEEEWSNEFVDVLIRLKHPPKFMIELPEDFVFSGKVVIDEL